MTTLLSTIRKKLSVRAFPENLRALTEGQNREVVPILRSLLEQWNLFAPQWPPDINSDFRLTTRTVTSVYTAQAWDDIVADPTGGTFLVNLPPATDPTMLGCLIVIRTNNERLIRQRVYVTPLGGTLIENAVNFELGGEYDSIVVSTNGFEWRVAAAYRPRRWVGAYSLDLTALPTQTIVNGANVIDGRTWTAENVGNATSVGIVNGLGLRIVASVTSTNYNNATRSSPLVKIPLLTGLMQFYGVTNHVVRLQAQVENVGANANFEGCRFGVEDLTAPTSQNFTVAKYFNTTAERISASSTVTATTTERGLSSNPAEDVLCVVFEAPTRFTARSGTYDGSGYMNADNPWHEEIQQMGTPALSFNTQPQMFFAQQTVNVTGSLTSYLKRVQVCFYEKNANINR